MIPILLAVGATSAVLELRRLVQRGGGEDGAQPEAAPDSERARAEEARLKEMLQVRTQNALVCCRLASRHAAEKGSTSSHAADA